MLYGPEKVRPQSRSLRQFCRFYIMARYSARRPHKSSRLSHAVQWIQHTQNPGMPARRKLKRLSQDWCESTTVGQGWHARVLSREMLSPSSHLQVLLKKESTGKLQNVLAVLSEITAAPSRDPALLRCLSASWLPAPCCWPLAVTCLPSRTTFGAYPATPRRSSLPFCDGRA